MTSDEIAPIIRVSTPAIEGVLQVSKWLKIQMLLGSEEMQALFQALEPFGIYNVSSPVLREEAVIDKGAFLEAYSYYVTALKNGTLPSEGSLRRFFSAAWSSTSDSFYAMEVGKDKVLVKPTKPVVQLQGHHFFYSLLDHKFHPMVLSPDSVTWGIQFSYPQIYQHPKSQLFSKVDNSPEFPNTELFRRLNLWMRDHSAPTPFLVGTERTNVPIRIGKKCFSWIAKHPQLVAKQIQVLSLSKV